MGSKNKHGANPYTQSDFRPPTSSGESTLRVIHTDGWNPAAYQAPDHTKVQRKDNKAPGLTSGFQPMNHRKIDRSPGQRSVAKAGERANLDHMNICDKPVPSTREYRMPSADKTQAALQKANAKDLADRNLTPPLNPDNETNDSDN